MVISNETNGSPYTCSQSYVLMQESLVTRGQKIDIIYEAELDYVFSLLLVLNFEHSDVLLVKVKVLVKYTHICLKFKLF